MYFLYIALVPVAYAYFAAGRSEIERRSDVVVVLSGLVTGLLSVIIDSLFSPILSVSNSLFFPRFLVIFLSDSLIPVLIGLMPLFFLAEGGLRERISALRIQAFGIAAVYLPYKMISAYDFPDAWSVCILPGMVLSILFLLDYFIGKLLSRFVSKPDVVDVLASLAPCALAVVCVDVAKSLWFFCFPLWTYLPLSFIVIFSAFFFRLRKYRH